MITGNSINRLIQKYSEYALFTGGVSEERIIEVENVLNTQLPGSYKWFLLHYGYGGMGGSEIEGVVPNGKMTVVERTEYYRRYGLPNHLIVIEDVGEYVNCLDISDISDEDCYVVTWSMHDNDGVINKTKSFFDFLLYRFYDEDEMDDVELYVQLEKVFDIMEELHKQKKKNSG
ncbi:SMI1/KNR4 family protein [Metabacillus indicus]|uniref:SMI1/KNR4 family protein n=1 Tax=Metabacillus indicus TaxID=246786 RepID=UPI003CEC9AE4